MDRKIFLFLGPSGSGKTTLGYFLRDELGIPELVSATTRAPRPGEINGVSYHFVTEEEFYKLDLLEDVVYSGSHYGTFKKEIDEKLDKCGIVYAIMNIDGVNVMKKHYGDAVKVIYCKCAPETLYDRMIERGDSKEKALERIQYLHSSGELTFDNFADLIIETDKEDIETCKIIIKDVVGG